MGATARATWKLNRSTLQTISISQSLHPIRMSWVGWWERFHEAFIPRRRGGRGNDFARTSQPSLYDGFRRLASPGERVVHAWLNFKLKFYRQPKTGPATTTSSDMFRLLCYVLHLMYSRYICIKPIPLRAKPETSKSANPSFDKALSQDHAYFTPDLVVPDGCECILFLPSHPRRGQAYDVLDSSGGKTCFDLKFWTDDYCQLLMQRIRNLY